MDSKTPSASDDASSYKDAVMSSSSFESNESTQYGSALSTSEESAENIPPFNPYLIDVPPQPPPPGTEDEVQADFSQNVPTTYSTITPLYANYSTHAYYHDTPPPSYSMRAYPGYPGFPYSFYARPSPYALYAQSYYEVDGRYSHYQQTAPYPSFSQTTAPTQTTSARSQEDSQPAPYQSYSVATAPTAGQPRVRISSTATSPSAIYSQAGASLVSHSQAGPLTSRSEDGPSTSYSQAGSSTSRSEDGPLTSYSQAGSSTSRSDPGPSISRSEAGPSTSRSDPGPSTSRSEAAPSTSRSEAGPSASSSEAGPSTSYSEAGPSTSYFEAGPSTSYFGAGPSTSYFGGGPSTSYFQASPSSSNFGAGPSTNYTEAGSSTSRSGPSTSALSDFRGNRVWAAPRQYPRYSQLYTVRVNNLDHGTTLETLRYYFRRYGPLGDLIISRDPITEASRGYAFVKYYDRNHAINAASAMTGVELEGRVLSAELLTPTTNTNQPNLRTFHSDQPTGTRGRQFTLKIKNIYYRATVDMLKQRLQRIGAVTYIRLPLRFNSVINKGYAFVRYANPKQALEAIRYLNNTRFQGRRLIIRQCSACPVSPLSSDTSDSDSR